MSVRDDSRIRAFVRSAEGILAIATATAIAVSLALRAFHGPVAAEVAPLIAVVVAGGVPLVWRITKDLWARAPGADLLAVLGIVTSALLGEWLVGAIIVLMLSGGEALENAATSRANAVLDALARRAPSTAHRVPVGGGAPLDVPVGEVEAGDLLLVLPHELCPVDGEVVDGHGTMDESYLTGEPYVITKSSGSAVLSGAVNGDAALTVRATTVAADSRYAKIVGVLTEAEQNRPRLRRLADRLGLWYTALAVVMGVAGWAISGDPDRFLAVMVIATPCPLLIAVPVAIVGAISLAARAGIIIKDPGVLERISTTDTMMFDKTGTLTYGRAALIEVGVAPGADEATVLRLAGELERYSRHPLASAITAATAGRSGADVGRATVEHISERPGEGLRGTVDGHQVWITSHRHAVDGLAEGSDAVPAASGGMECVVVVDGAYEATLQFRDEPRIGSTQFVQHLAPRHGIAKTMLISGDRSNEVEYLAQQVGITEVHAGCSPEEKLRIVREESARGRTLFLGDGINDAPAMAAADVGIAFGTVSDVTSEAAGAVVLDSSLERLDELFHISERMRRIALQSALGGIGLSLIGMGFAVVGWLPPIAGAVTQEAIDLLAILNAARVAVRRTPMADYEGFDLRARAAALTRRRS